MTIEFNSYEEKMDKTLNNLKKEYLGLRTGRASASLLEPISVDALWWQGTYKPSC